MKNLNKLITSAFLTAFLMTSQSAMATDEKQEVIPPASSHTTTPHEHKVGNSENDSDLDTDDATVAKNEDNHHEKESMDDTNQ